MPRRKIIGDCWVFEFKTNDLKGGAKCKAPLVTQGFSQVPGIDFHLTYIYILQLLASSLGMSMIGSGEATTTCSETR